MEISNEQIRTRNMTSEELNKVIQTVRSSLEELAYKFENVSERINPETAQKVIELVQLLRPMKVSELERLWEECLTSEPKTR